MPMPTLFGRHPERKALVSYPDRMDVWQNPILV